MKSKGRRRLKEWGKNLLILLLAVSAVYLLGRAQITGNAANGLRGLLGEEPPAAAPSSPVSTAAMLRPHRLAVCQNGQRYGLQYDQAGIDEAFSGLSTLLSEALSSASQPVEAAERDWRDALGRTGIYADFLYPLPLPALSALLGDGQANPALAGTARRLCLAADGPDGVSLFYMNEEDGGWYSCSTTLSQTVHLAGAVAPHAPNGALFAFEVPGMAELDPYTLLTATLQPAVYTAENPLLQDGDRISQLLSALSFHSQGGALDPVAGGQLMGDSDSLRLSKTGVLTFHTIGDEDARFPLPGEGLREVLGYVHALAESVAGAWPGEGRLCLSGVEETGGTLEITFQYSLGGVPVSLTEGPAARFVVRGGAVTDFTLHLRSYSQTGEVSPVLPETLAAAAMEPLRAQGKELTLIYEDSGADRVSAGWVAK